MRAFTGMHLLLILPFISFSRSIARDTVTPNNPLPDNETLISSDGTFSLGFFRPSSSSSNLYLGLWYGKITPKTIVWVANRKDPVINSTAVLSISSNGSLLITNQDSTVIWSSGVKEVTNPVAQLLDTGNLVVRSDDDHNDQSYAWQGFDHPTDTLIAGMKLGVDFTKGLNRTLTAWTSSTDPSPSQYYVMMDIRGSPELVVGEGSNKMWRSGPWNGRGYSGIPETLSYSGFSFSFINNKQEITYSFTTNQSLVSRVTLNASGLVQRWLLVDSSGFWNLMWYAPSDQCDFSPLCGPYATCNPNNSPKCECIQGFKPKSQDKWVFRDASDGCVRKTPLDCKNGTDGFLTVPKTKLADTWNATVDTSLSLMECKARCLNICECNGFAPADVRNGGSGCIIWTSELTDLRVFIDDAYGQDLYVRMASADLGEWFFFFFFGDKMICLTFEQ
ncbi:putative S-locus glycoprotein [Dioscorea sansibarensis]